ncbi:fimbria/pilus periplasmic chaperone [Providencia manganoxydans]|uniref:Gram-negative pili assembly chaperone domain protein n=2 Tax=Providencia TaxID=586 RepID=A0AA86YEM3_PROST|nr:MULTISPECIES: fimbria/pilus periplasmic chaperone [Providencia]EDU57490.1 gram-negative pili assembly chaperone domain protein [Providencia stuartii ATCC 25827]MDN7225424.1 fimbria/pilus periplasmic chaperone [Providencia stuartii]MDW7590893.1 fimbria/pilus periplasmic chaperone [Providencia sp. 2023EL-00965]RMA08588.1 Clp protease ClpE [Providencia stuartii]WAZ78051.1 fimbria/pilus periplasmic chaperone [Providencia stuartii]
MNIKRLSMGVLAALSLMTASSAWAALSVDQSRYIFEGDKDAVSIVVENASPKTYGGQTWIENIKEVDTRPTFVVTPPFFKVAGNGKQVLRVIKALEQMPEDKESIYWVSLQEIPPLNKDGGLSVALRTKVKLLYRPASLMKDRKGAESGLSVKTVDGKTELVNSTPYIFAIADVLGENDTPLAFDQKQHEALAMFTPGDSVTLPKGTTAKKVVSIDDLGHLGTHVLTGKTAVTSDAKPEAALPAPATPEKK